MRRLLNLLPWRRRRLDADLARELRYHLDRRIEDFKERGLDEAEARRLAAIEFGGIASVREDVRDTWVWRWLDGGERDLRHAVRVLRRSPGFTATALLSLAIGIGASAALFSLVDQVLLRPLPVREPEGLVHLAWKGNALATGWGDGYKMSYPMCRELQEQRDVFDGVFCRYPTSAHVSTSDRTSSRVRAEMVSGSYFPVLGVAPVLGRLIGPSDDVERGAHPVVVLSHAFWLTQFGGDQAIIGRTLLVNNYPLTVIGVAPRGFSGVDPHVLPALWMPAAMAEQVANVDAYWNRLLDRRAAWLHAFGRLQPGVTADHAKVALAPWFRSMLEADTGREGFPQVSAEQRRAFLASTLDVMAAPRGLSSVRGALERPLWMLMGGTLVLLMLATLNIAGLLLARGAARARELTTRMAIGATRSRIAGQLLVESLLVTICGGALGLAAAPALSRAVLLFLSPGTDVALHLDLRVVLFAVAASIATGVLCGVAPAAQTGRIPLVASLNERSRIGAGAGISLRKAIVIAQMAFTLIVIIGAGLFVQTLTRLHDQVGFESGNLVMVSIDPPEMGYAADAAERAMREVMQRLEALPMVAHASVANSTLLTGGTSSTNVTIEADRRFVSDRAVSRMRVGPGFFSTLGTTVVAGRDFDDRELRASGTPPRPYRAIIVNESFARRYFKDRNPLGARMGLGDRPTTATTMEIVGVVKDFSRRTLRDGEYEQVFVPFWDQNSGDGTFYLKLRASAGAALPSIRAAVADVDPALPVSLTIFGDQIEQSLKTERLLATVSSAFGAIALLLAVVGLYGVTSFVVTQRTAEIGVRIALGATRPRALWLILRDAAIMIAAGVLIALPVASALRRFVESQLFGVGAFDVPTILIASVVLATVALSSAMLPAWRAASINPTDALRL